MDSSQSGGEDESPQDNGVFLYYHDHDNDSEDEKFPGIHKIECNTFWEMFESGRILGEVIPIPKQVLLKKCTIIITKNSFFDST